MAFEIIKGLQTLAALVKRLAGGRPELADQSGLKGTAARALYSLFGRKQFHMAYTVTGIGRGNAIVL